MVTESQGKRSHSLSTRPNSVLSMVLGGFVLAAGTMMGGAGQTAIPFEDWISRSREVWEPQLLPGTHGFVFSSYGTPGEVGPLRQLAAVMRDQRLGNGFDPGPSPRPGSKGLFDELAKIGWPVMCYPGCGDMQVKGGRCVMGREDEAVLVPMDRAGVFTAVQLGEWGYYFHNLSHNAGWWHDVFGPEFPQFESLIKPAGLAGYDRRPASKRECYEVVKDYFDSRSRDMLGRIISVTGHSHYEAYAAEWGARCIGLEVGENIGFTQSKLAFARGASRQWRRPWSAQVSPWFSGSCTTAGELREEGGGARGLDAGHSLSLYERLWLHAWFAGAAMVTPENSIAIFFEKSEAPWKLTSHARKASEVFQFTQAHDRGTPWTPVAVVLDHFAGYNGYMDRPWGILEPTPGDRELRDLFDTQLFPGADTIHVKADPENPEGKYLCPTPYGEMFDVLLTSVPPEVLPTYPVILLAGDIDFGDAFLGELEKALRRGSRVLIAPRHQAALGTYYARLQRQGDVEVLASWTNPATGRPAAVSGERLEQLARDYLPIEVGGDTVEYQINKTAKGWVVELIHNRGVTKKPKLPAVVDKMAVARVSLKPRISWSRARDWKTGVEITKRDSLALTIGPGETQFVEFEAP